MMFIHNKKWIDHLIVIVGVLVGVCIILGLLATVISILVVPKASHITLTEQDTNLQHSMHLTDTLILRLPETEYAPNVVMTSIPEGVLSERRNTEPASSGYWTKTYRPVKKGTVALRVESIRPDIPEFYITLTVE